MSTMLGFSVTGLAHSPSALIVSLSQEPERSPTHAERDQSLFDRISAGYAAKDLNRAARLAREHRLKETLLGLGLDATGRILEVGCGAGFSADYLAGCFGQYVGLDYSAGLIDCAKQRWANRPGSVAFHVADASSFVDPERFDIIFMIGVLHHMEDPHAALKRLIKLLKPGSTMVCNEPSGLNPAIQWLRRIRTKVDSAYSADQATYRPKALIQLFEGAGFTAVEVRPQGLFSTPFAEVPLRPDWLFAIPARLACSLDHFLIKHFGRFMLPCSWNLVVSATRPM